MPNTTVDSPTDPQPQPFVSRAAFARWLDTHAGQELIGVPGQADSCPLSTYLGTLGIRAEIHADHWIAYHDVPGCSYQLGISQELPTWARLFAALVDETGYPAINARAARKLLRTITTLDD